MHAYGVSQKALDERDMSVYGSLLPCLDDASGAPCCNALNNFVGPSGSFNNCLCVKEVSRVHTGTFHCVPSHLPPVVPSLNRTRTTFARARLRVRVNTNGYARHNATTRPHGRPRGSRCTWGGLHQGRNGGRPALGGSASASGPRPTTNKSLILVVDGVKNALNQMAPGTNMASALKTCNSKHGTDIIWAGNGC
eukprot:5313120-Pyramimonas_sp.AAC.1